MQLYPSFKDISTRQRGRCKFSSLSIYRTGTEYVYFVSLQNTDQPIGTEIVFIMASPVKSDSRARGLEDRPVAFGVMSTSGMISEATETLDRLRQDDVNELVRLISREMSLLDKQKVTIKKSSQKKLCQSSMCTLKFSPLDSQPRRPSRSHGP